MSRRAARLGLLCAFCTMAGSARAESARTSSLSWVRPAGAEGCIATAALAKSVEERLGRPVFVSAAEAQVSVEGLVQHSARRAGWTASLTLRDASGVELGRRELHRDGADCHALDASLALVIAVMIDPDAKAEEPSSVPPPPPEPPRTIVQKEVVVVQVAAPPAPPPRKPWRFDGGASALLLLGPLPSAAFGAQADGLLEPPGWPSLQGFGAVIPFSRAAAAAGGSFAMSFGVLGSGVCPLRHHGDRLHVVGCFQGQLGLLVARAEGFAHTLPNETLVKLYVANSIATRATLRVVGPLSLRAGLGFAVPWFRPRFTYEDAGVEHEVHRVAPVAFTADLGVGVVFP